MKFNLILTKIFRIFLFVIPSLIFWALLLFLAYDLVNHKTTTPIFIIYQAIIVVSLSMAAVTFGYARAVKSDKRKYSPLIFCGERFMDATFLSLIAFIFVYAQGGFIQNYFRCTNQICDWFGKFLNVIAIVFLMTAVHQIDFSIKKILEITGYDIKKYDIDNITQNWKW